MEVLVPRSGQGWVRQRPPLSLSPGSPERGHRVPRLAWKSEARRPKPVSGELRPVKGLAFQGSGVRISAPGGGVDSGVAASERGRRGLSVEPAFKPLGPGLRVGARNYGGP
ncbi:hypothetical protein ROHU_015944 [Labeo rohita]|uniref:Uncharacterized protein n=1 Tax=Labeo rohita TaxID=84645 RepID=A0A498NMF7_LABRO|nr:hypothetical protein ROHU_015944 [Labeo rohita]